MQRSLLMVFIQVVEYLVRSYELSDRGTGAGVPAWLCPSSRMRPSRRSLISRRTKSSERFGLLALHQLGKADRRPVPRIRRVILVRGDVEEHLCKLRERFGVREHAEQKQHEVPMFAVPSRIG